jgi:two-component system sensor histidine kinase DesK
MADRLVPAATTNPAGLMVAAVRHDGIVDSPTEPGFTTGDDCSAPAGHGFAARERLIGRRRWILGALVAQLFLISAYVQIAGSDELTLQAKIGSLTALLAFSAVYIFLVGRTLTEPISRRLGVIGLLAVLSLPQFLIMGTSATVLWVFVAVAGGMLLPDWAAVALGLSLAGLMLLIDYLAGEPLGWELALTLIALTAFMVGFAGNVRLNIELRATREQLAEAAVAAERERIGRDLHDILGHSLTAIAVKAGLARRLLGRDDAGAAVEIADVERLAREALADVRATASGMREVTLAGELAVAGTVLRAAGVRSVLPQAVDELDPAARHLFGYVLREAVTNVVRHAQARTCTVQLTPTSIQIIDDGSAVRPDTDHADGELEPGNGLVGLAARVQAAGGTFFAGPGAQGGFVVRATVPVTMPAGRPDDGAAAPVTTLPGSPVPLPATGTPAPARSQVEHGSVGHLLLP